MIAQGLVCYAEGAIRGRDGFVEHIFRGARGGWGK